MGGRGKGGGVEGAETVFGNLHVVIHTKVYRKVRSSIDAEINGRLTHSTTADLLRASTRMGT